MKNYKFLIPATLILTMGMMMSCSKSFIERQPEGVITSLTDSASAVEGTNAIYGALRKWEIHVFAWLGITQIASDESDKGSTPDDASFFLELKNYTIKPGSSGAAITLNDYWSGQYFGINRANIVIDAIPTISVSTVLRNRLGAEAKFLRAYFYFNLVRTFGGVPIILHIGNQNNTATRATVADTYAQIESDLNFAITNLPDKQSDVGRATKNAAKTLLAKVSMYEKKWNQVLSLTTDVINSGLYSLYPDVKTLWRGTGTYKNLSESIFEVQCGSGQVNNGGGIQYPQVQGPRTTNTPPGIDGGWGFNNPSQALVDSFESGDPRLKATIIRVGSHKTPTNPNPYRGDTLYDFSVADSSLVNNYYNNKAYISLTDVAPFDNGNAPKNIMILRYAEVLLMHAEASNETGDPATAVADVNKVRARARGTNTTILPDISVGSTTSVRLAIWHERLVELAMEQDRWWDVIRQGRGVQIFGPTGANPNSQFTAGKNEVWPIPQHQIDLDPNLTQNPGY